MRTHDIRERLFAGLDGGICIEAARGARGKGWALYVAAASTWSDRQALLGLDLARRLCAGQPPKRRASLCGQAAGVATLSKKAVAPDLQQYARWVGRTIYEISTAAMANTSNVMAWRVSDVWLDSRYTLAVAGAGTAEVARVDGRPMLTMRACWLPPGGHPRRQRASRGIEEIEQMATDRAAALGRLDKLLAYWEKHGLAVPGAWRVVRDEIQSGADGVFIK